MSTIRQEERIIKWIFNSKDYDTLDMWLTILKFNNFHYKITRLMFILIQEDWEKTEDYNQIIKERGYEHYYQLTHETILEAEYKKSLDTKK